MREGKNESTISARPPSFNVSGTPVTSSKAEKTSYQYRYTLLTSEPVILLDCHPHKCEIIELICLIEFELCNEIYVRNYVHQTAYHRKMVVVLGFGMDNKNEKKKCR
jgi:hypothetical protein